MPRAAHLRLSDLRGTSRLAIEATLGVTRLVETLHHNIARVPGVLGPPTEERTRGVTGLVYRSICGVTRLVGGGIDAVLAPLERLVEGPAGTGGALSSAERDAVLAALNGVLGDHLARSGNPLSTGMRLRTEGAPTGKILLLAHGLCLNDRQWRRKGHDHGAALAADGGLTRVYLRYNSGLPLASNGRELAGHLENLLRDWPVPVEELVILAHSMGGLVVRHACHIGEAEGHAWRRHLRKIVFLGTPHHGAPLEKGGHWVDLLLGASPYTAALARIGKIRSAGITDLRHGSDLPLPAGVAVYAIAGSIARKDEIGLKDKLLGDGLVPLRSALGEHADPGRSLGIPASRQWAGYGLGHFDLLDDREVYERIREWVVAQPGEMQPLESSRA